MAEKQKYQKSVFLLSSLTEKTVCALKKVFSLLSIKAYNKTRKQIINILITKNLFFCKFFFAKMPKENRRVDKRKH